MPIYEYQCRTCEHRFEQFVLPPRPETHAASCPNCHGIDLERLLSAFAVNSQSTRQTHLQQARRAGMPVARDKKHAEIELIKRVEVPAPVGG